MKKLFTPICLLVLNLAQGQYFQQRFNLDYVTPNFRNERCNSGIRTRVNLGGGGNPLLHYYAGIGTSFNNTVLPAPNNVADRMRFEQLDNTGTVVLTDFGYQFADAAAGPWYHSYGNSIAEIKNATYNGGYVTVGKVSNNTITGAAAIVGKSDALFTQLNAAGGVVSSMRYDINGGEDEAWCIRSSAVLVGGLPTWILCGQSKKNANNTDCFVARVFATGVPVWFNRYNFDPTGGAFSSAHNIAKQLCEDTGGNIYVVGTLQDAPAGASGIDGLVFKLTPAGAPVWANDYNIASDDEFQAVRFTGDGNLIIGGFTNFGAVAPVTSHMLITKLNLAGGIIFQNVLPARKGATTYTSKCYDIIEAGGPQYFLAGPRSSGAANFEMMYKTGPAGIGINWYSYNRMNYNVGFGLDDVNVAGVAGVAYFSSMRNTTASAFSDSHIMKTDYIGRTCNFCSAIPPANIPLQMEIHPRQWFFQQTGQARQLVAQLFGYQNKLICNQPVVICAAPAITEAESEESEASAVPLVKAGSVKVFPNPVKNTVHVQLSSLPAGSYQISVANTAGRIVLQRNYIYNSGSLFTDLDISSFTPGIYILTVKQGELILQQKIMKE